MKAACFIVDAFTDTLFRGNTCAVWVLPEWRNDALLQQIAIQNQVPETAFIVSRNGEHPELRWFTVSQEVDFCGYGTLSAGFVYLTQMSPSQADVTFATRRYGFLPVQKTGGLFQIEVPVKKPSVPMFDEGVFAALGGPRPETMAGNERGDLLVVYSREEDVRAVAPDFPALMTKGHYGYVLTSRAKDADFAYRYFSPRLTNVWEDPVNGASLSVLAPFWVQRLEKPMLHGQAVSTRGGDVYCDYQGGPSVKIGGRVVLYLRGEMVLPAA